MGTPVRNGVSAASRSSKNAAAILAADAAVSPPFIIEWRQSRSPDVVISPASVGDKKVQRQTRGMISAFASKAAHRSLETPHHEPSLTSLSSKNFNTPDDLEEQVPAKKPKPVRLESLLELKSVVAAARRQQQPVVISPLAAEPGPSVSNSHHKRFASASYSNTGNNDSLNDDSYNQLLSQIVDSVSEAPNILCSPVQKPRQQFLASSRQSLPPVENSTTSTPLRRSIRHVAKPYTPKLPSNVFEQDEDCNSNSSTSSSKQDKTSEPSCVNSTNNKPPVISVYEEDDDDLLLLAALEQAEGSTKGPSPTAPSSKNLVPSVENTQQQKPPSNKRQFNLVAPPVKPLQPVNNVKQQTTVNQMLSGPVQPSQAFQGGEGSKGGLTSSEKAKIEAKRLAALSKLQQRNQTATVSAPLVQNISKPFASMTVAASNFAGPNCTNTAFRPTLNRAHSINSGSFAVRPQSSYGASNLKR